MSTVEKYRLEVLARLADTVHQRRTMSAEKSYTAQLIGRGLPVCAKKLGEEAVEVAIAAALGDRKALTAEVADLMFHLTVLLEAADLPLADVMAELERREGVSGIVEKASRK